MKRSVIIFYVILSFLITFNVSANTLPPIIDFAADVDPHSGSANLSLPILTPQGRGGIQPNINLQYNSRLGNSHLGVGWLMEFGAIQVTTTQGVPKYDGNDGFCLLQAGSTQGLVYDSSAGFYRTEIEGAFSKIEYDSINDNWTITDKNGVKYFFGLTNAEREYDPADSTRIFKWNISKVEDVHGNYMLYTYTRDGNRLYPVMIEYTGNSAQSLNPHANVVFSLEDRPDKQSSYISGFERKQDKRIKDITVNAKIIGVDNLYRKYELTYDYSANTNRSLLKEFKEIGADAITALPLKQLTYSDDAVHTYSLMTVTDNVPTGDNKWFYRAAGGYDHGSSNYGPCPPPNMCFGALNWQPDITMGDSNGNISFSGNKDSAYWIWTYLYVTEDTTINVSDPMSGPDGIYLNGNYGTNVGYTWNLKAGYNRIDITSYHQNSNFSFNLNVNLATQVDLMHSTQLAIPKIGADYNGDGLTDAGNFNAVSGNFEVSLSTSGGFVPQTQWISSFGAGKNALVGHFDQNGYIDIAVFDSNNDNWQFALSDGTSFKERSYLRTFNFTGSNKKVGAADFDADGLTDLYATYDSGANLILDIAENYVNNPTTGIPFRFIDQTYPQGKIIGPAGAQAIPADFNADGLTDFASFTKTSGDWNIYLNPGDRNDEFILLQTITGYGANFNPVVADFNADGLADIGYYDHNLAKVKYRINKGTIETTDMELPATFSLTGAAIKIQSGDYNGDGLTDIVAYDDIGTCDLASSSGDPSDLFISISNGVGGSTAIEYASSAQFDNTMLPFVTNMVHTITNSTAQGDSYTNEYFYEGGLWDPLYRQFRGFAKVTAKDPENNTTVSQFHQGHIVSDNVRNFSFAPWHAFDDYGDPSGYAFSAKSSEKAFTLDYGFGPGNEQIIKKYTLKCGYSINPELSSPHDWTFEGSNDNKNWVVLDTQINQGAAFSGGGTVAYNSFSNDQAYAYYRLNVTKSGSNPYIYVYEMEMMDSTTSNEDLTLPVYDNGRLIEQASYDANGNLFSKTKNTWAAELITDFILFPSLKRKDNFVYDGDATGRRTAEEFFYEEATQYGNLTKAVQYGEVDLNDGSDIGTDSRSVETAYVNNTTDWIIGLPANTTVKNNASTQVRHTWFYYDNQLNSDPPLKGLLTKKEDWNGNLEGHVNNPQTEYTYDVYGNLLTTTDPLDKVTTIAYDTDYNIFPKQTQNALTHQVANKYYGVEGEALDDGAGLKGLWGQLKGTTDPNNHQGKRVFDTFGRLVATVSPLDTVTNPTMTTEYELTSSYTKIKTSQRIEHGQAPVISASRFIDGLGRELQTKTPSGVTGQYVVRNQQEYNVRGLPEKQYLPYFTTNNLDILDSIDTAKPKSTITYDAMGRAVTTTNPDGSYASIAYDDWTLRNINENGHKQESDFDAYGRLIEKREYTGADGRAATYYPLLAYTLYGTTKYTYDSEGNLAQTDDAHNNLTTISYDDLGRKISMNDPDMGVWSYQYDLNGNLTKQTDAKNQVIDFSYDSLNRLTEKIEQASSTLDVNYTYDTPTVSNSIGRLVDAVYGINQNTSFEYDALGRESKSTKTIDAQGFSVERTYDALNNIIQIQYPDLENVYYDYNDAGQIKAISNDPALFDQGAFLYQQPAPSNEHPPTIVTKLFSLFERYVLGIKPAYADEYYIGQFEWVTEMVEGAGGVEEPISYWQAPHADKLTGVLDLRNLPDQARAGGSARGWALFSYSEPISHKKLIHIADNIDNRISAQKMAVLNFKLGILLRNLTLKDVIDEILTQKGDPGGKGKWKPYLPGRDNRTKIHFGSQGKILDRSLKKKGKHWSLVKKVHQENYRRMLKTYDHDMVSKHLDWLEEKYGVHYSNFQPKDEIQLASLPHETVFTESWDCPDSSSGNIDCDNDWSRQTGLGNNWRIESNQAKSADITGPLIFRLESDLSGDDHYAQAKVVYTKSTTTKAGVAVRSNDALDEHYIFQARRKTTNTFYLIKRVGGVETHLATVNDTAWSAPVTLKLEVNGSNLEGFIDGVSKITVTDTAITGHLRVGIRQQSRIVKLDDFEAGDLTTGGTGTPPTLFVENVEYNAAGQITKIEYGNGNVTTREYDLLTLRLTRILTVDAQLVSLQDLNYTYDPAGNIVRIDDYVETATQDFEYDAQNRLVEAIGTSYGTKTYSYDEIGNLLAKDGKTYTYGEGPAGPHAVTSLSDGTTFTYDANGNMATKQLGSDLTEYIYDTENRLVEVKLNSVSQATYSYDGDGGRTKKITASGTTKYVGSIYEERNGIGNSYVYLGDIRVASIAGGDVKYLHQDHLGGTNILTDDLGVSKELIEYTPFGSLARHDMYGTSEEVAHFYFTGKELDEEVGLIYFAARYYNPELGRFLQPDTIVPYTNDSQSFNRYSYVRNNPTNLVDPDGHFFFAALIVGAVLGGVSAAVNDQPIWKGALLGATSGIFVGTGASAFGLGGAIGGGMLGGALNGTVNGGDIGASILAGGLGAGLGYGLGSWASGWNGFSFWGGLGAAAISGSVAGGVGAELSGGRFGQGAWMGAAFSSGGFFGAKAINNLDPRIRRAKIRRQQAKARHSLNVKRNDMIKIPVGRRPVSFFEPAGHEFLPGWEMGPNDAGYIKTSHTVSNLSKWKTHIETQKAIASGSAQYTTAEVSASGLVEAMTWYEQGWVDTNTRYSGVSYNSNSAVNTVIYAAGGSVPNASGWNPAFESVPSSIHHAYGYWGN